MTITAQQPTESAHGKDPRSLISPELLARLVDRICEEHNVPERFAERVMVQALGFLQACALNPGAGLAPSETVDIGWHAFILHTREYAEFCQRVAGRFVHHAPNENGAAVQEAEAISATVAAMRTAGIDVDPQLWEPSSKCSQCYAGCSDSPGEA
ncbi:glycine-rich domain-containing protein [Spirillospora sp. NPDC127200]